MFMYKTKDYIAQSEIKMKKPYPFLVLILRIISVNFAHCNQFVLFGRYWIVKNSPVFVIFTVFFHKNSLFFVIWL